MALRITVVGCGYLGATHAACMAEMGFEVLGMDVDEGRTQALQEASPPFYEPGLEPLLRKHVDSGRLRFTTSLDEVADFGDVHFLCVSTPQREGELAADVSRLEAAVAALAPRLRRPCLVVGKSTVPVGTAERLATTLAELAPVGAEAVLAWNPEFLREGHGLDDTLHPGRIVFGLPAGEHAELAERTLREVYAETIAGGTPVVLGRPGHGRADEGGGERVPGHQDLLHQRHGGAVRGHRRRRGGARGRNRLRPEDRPPVPQRRARVRRGLPAQGHPWVHGTGRRARRRRRAHLPARGGRDQPASQGTRRGHGRGARRPALGRREGRRARCRLQAGVRRHPRLARRSTWPDGCTCSVRT